MIQNGRGSSLVPIDSVSKNIRVLQSERQLKMSASCNITIALQEAECHPGSNPPRSGELDAKGRSSPGLPGFFPHNVAWRLSGRFMIAASE